MAKPALTESGERLYEQLAQAFFPTDEEENWAGLLFITALAKMKDPAAEVVQPAPSGTKPPFAVLFCPSECPTAWLPWVGQFVGIRASEMEALIATGREVLAREWLIRPLNYLRGTAEGMRQAALATLYETTNWVPNPTFAHDVNGAWPAGWEKLENNAATETAESIIEPGFTQSAEIEGLHSYCVIHCGGTEILEGISTGPVIPVKNGVPITAAVFLKEEVEGNSVRIKLKVLGGGSKTTVVTQTKSGKWVKHEVTLTPTKSGHAFLDISGTESAPTVQTIKFTAAFTGASFTSGDTAGFAWNGTPGNSPTIEKPPTLNATIFFYPRFNEEAFVIKVATLASQTPNPQQTREALEAMMPAWCLLEYETITGGNVGTAEAAHAKVSESEAADATVKEAELNPSK